MVCRFQRHGFGFVGRRGGACPSRIPQGNTRVTTGRASHGPYHGVPIKGDNTQTRVWGDPPHPCPWMLSRSGWTHGASTLTDRYASHPPQRSPSLRLQANPHSRGLLLGFACRSGPGSLLPGAQTHECYHARVGRMAGSLSPPTPGKPGTTGVPPLGFAHPLWA